VRAATTPLRLAALFCLPVAAAAASDVALEAGTVRGMPGDRVAFDVVLRSDAEVVGTQNELTLPRGLQVPPRLNGRPSCEVGDEVPGPTGASYSYLPAGCTVGDDCTGLRVLILSLENVDPIADGTVLYSCSIDIAAAAAPGTYVLAMSGVKASNIDGGAVDASGIDGAVIVELPTATPTETISPTVTATPSATGSPTATARPQRDSGCAVVGPRDSGAITALPALLLLLRRLRRGRRG
jgi:hypothetical protein